MKSVIKIAKTFHFEMAHVLDGHDGQCRNLHGHSYTLRIELTGKTRSSGPKAGMVMDYKDIKKTVEEVIVFPMDHAFCFDNGNVRERQIADLLISLQLKVYAVPARTTAENLARHIFLCLQERGLILSAVYLAETRDSWCEYREDQGEL